MRSRSSSQAVRRIAAILASAGGRGDVDRSPRRLTSTGVGPHIESVTRTTSLPAIEHSLDLADSPPRIWRVLTDPASLAEWFCDETTFLAEPGADGTFARDGRGHTSFRVERVEPPRHLAWRWASEPGIAIDDGPATLVEWWLVPADDGGTRLTIRESGFLDAAARRPARPRLGRGDAGPLVLPRDRLGRRLRDRNHLDRSGPLRRIPEQRDADRGRPRAQEQAHGHADDPELHEACSSRMARPTRARRS